MDFSVTIEKEGNIVHDFYNGSYEPLDIFEERMQMIRCSINIDDNTQNMVRPYFTKAIKQINNLDDKHKIEFKGLLTNYKKIFLHLKIIALSPFSPYEKFVGTHHFSHTLKNTLILYYIIFCQK